MQYSAVLTSLTPLEKIVRQPLWSLYPKWAESAHGHIQNWETIHGVLTEFASLLAKVARSRFRVCGDYEEELQAWGTSQMGNIRRFDPSHIINLMTQSVWRQALQWLWCDENIMWQRFFTPRTKGHLSPKRLDGTTFALYA